MSFELLTGEMHGVCILNWKWFRMFVSQDQQELKFAYNKVRKQLQEKVMEKPLILVIFSKYIIHINYTECSLGSVSLEPWLTEPNFEVVSLLNQCT